MREPYDQLLERFDTFFSRPGVVVVPVSSEIIERATVLRAEHGFKTPDAIHLATAVNVLADCFLTGDASLARCPGLTVDVVSWRP